MASQIRITSVRMRALASSISISSVSNYTNVSSGVSYRDTRLLASVSNTEALASYRHLELLTSWVGLSATNIFIDPTSLNQYFRSGHTISMLEALALNISKASEDTPVVTETLSRSTGKNTTDKAYLYEFIEITIEYLRSLDEAITLADLPTVGLEKPFIENLFSSDSINSIDTDRAASDTTTIIDQPTIVFSAASDDSISISDNFTSVVTYLRDFSDSFTLDDSANVDSFTKDTASNKSNVLFMAEDTSFTFGKSASDSFSVIDTPEIAFGASVEDSISTSEAHALHVSKATDDSISVSEAYSIAFNTAVSDGLSAAETLFIQLGSYKSDTLSIADITSSSVSKVNVDAFGISESFDRAVAYTRQFSDSFTLDDFTDVDAFVKDTTANKTNVFSMVEIHAMSMSKVLADSFSVVELAARSVDKQLLDSFGVTESLSISLVAGVRSSVPNENAINAFVFNE